MLASVGLRCVVLLCGGLCWFVVCLLICLFGRFVLVWYVVCCVVLLFVCFVLAWGFVLFWLWLASLCCFVVLCVLVGVVVLCWFGLCCCLFD